MKLKTILLASTICLSSCATWGETARDAISMVHHGGVILREKTFPEVNKICALATSRCIDRGDRTPETCPELRECDDARAKIGEALKTIQSGVKVSFVALERLEALGLTPDGGGL